VSKLTDFYLENGRNSDGVMLSNIMEWNDGQWEYDHSFIQWLFPLKTPSNFNPDAPLLSNSDIELFKENCKLQNNLLLAFAKFTEFLGLKMVLYGGDLKEKEQVFLKVQQPRFLLKVNCKLEKDEKLWKEKEGIWKYQNHNWLRITRVIASLKLLGLDGVAEAFFSCIKQLYNEGYGSPESFAHWQKASEGLIE
jgi:hypothetical protein